MRRLAFLSVLWAITLWAGMAQASLIISGSFDGGAAVIAKDNDVTSTCGAIAVGCQLPDQDPTVGVLTLGPTTAGTGGGLNIQGTVQTSDKATGPGTLNRLDSTGTQVTATTGTHTYAVVISDTSFVGPVVSATTTGAGQFSHLGGGYGATDILMQWYNDPTNQQGAEDVLDKPGLLLDTFAFVPAAVTNPSSFSHNGGPFAVDDPALFSMTLAFSGTLAEGVRLTGREMTEIKPLAVPAPGTGWVLALGAGLLIAGALTTTKQDRSKG